MATLAGPDGSDVRLRPQTLVGRSRACDLRLNHPSASGQHALIRWTGDRWEVRDLGSRNGTFVQGRRIGVGERVHLHPGEQLGFGGQDPAWVLSTDSPPGAVAVSGEVEVHAQGGWITLPPGDESPEISVYSDHAGRWVVEKAGEIEPAPDQVVVAGRVWVLELPVAVVSTFQTSPAGIETNRLRFFVSADEETTHVVVVTGELERRLADRTHHYLLLTLARQRLEHRQEGYSSEEEGWIHREDLADALRMDQQHLNVQIHRARRQFADEGMNEAARIIERRALSGQLRLGVGEFDIVRL